MTLYIVIVTCFISIAAFYNQEVFSRLQFNPYQAFHRKEYYRMLSHALVHADWFHLIINMYVMYSFGAIIERYFYELHDMGLLHFPKLYFIFFYATSVLVASISTLSKYKDEPLYNSVGASGGVSAIVFSFIFFNPWQKLYFFGLVPIPGIVFGAVYLIYSHIMSRRNVGNINHDAHYWGAVYGFIFPLFIDPKLINIFINHLISFR